MEYIEKQLSDFQKKEYTDREINSIGGKIARYEAILVKLTKNRDQSKPLRILDIGGGHGYFAKALRTHLKNIHLELFVLDITEYDTKNELPEINFIKDSAFNAENHFTKDTFDIVFVTYTFHHLVQKTYKQTIGGIKNCLTSIRNLLVPGGMLCISECNYYIPIINNLSSFLAYKVSTIRIPFISPFFRKLGIKSSGVGVCFMSLDKWKALLIENGFVLLDIQENPIKTVRLTIKEHFFSLVASKA